MDTKHVVVIGGGFGGLHAVRTLARDYRVRVTLVDQNNYHLFQPLLYQVAIAGLEAPQIAFPIRAYLRRFPRARFHLGRVTGVEPDNKIVWVDDAPLKYDYLIVGIGSQSADFGIPGVNEHAVGLKSLKEAISIRDRVLSACEEAVHTTDPRRRRALLTFPVIGGGATGVELAGAIGELRKHVIPRDYPELNPDEIRIPLIELQDRLLGHLQPSSSQYSREFLESLNVEVMTETAVREVRPTEVLLKSGDSIETFNAIWSAGVRARHLEGLPAPTGQGRIATTDELSLPEDDRVFVIGDQSGAVAPGGGFYPQVAPLAIQQGVHAAKNILRDIGGNPRAAFKYFDKGNMVTLGRNHAVAEVRGMQIRGFPAWAAWLGVHLLYLLGGRNRFMVLSNWAYSYFTYDYAVRTMYKRVDFPALTWHDQSAPETVHAA